METVDWHVALPLLVVFLSIAVALAVVLNWVQQDRRRQRETEMLLEETCGASNLSFAPTISKFSSEGVVASLDEHEAALYQIWLKFRLPCIAQQRMETARLNQAPQPRPLNKEEAREYFQRENLLKPENLDAGWLRTLDGKGVLAAKNSLITSCVKYISQHRQMQVELDNAWKLYQQELLPERTWQTIRVAFQNFSEAKVEFTFEAEKISKEFGSDLWVWALELYQRLIEGGGAELADSKKMNTGARLSTGLKKKS